MLRTLRITTLLLITMSTLSQPAKADWWDFFAELSGPGPFNGRGKLPENATAAIYCHGVSSGSGFFRLLDRGDSWGPCIFADVRLFEAPDDDTALEIVTKLSHHGAEQTETLRAFTRDEAESIIKKL